MPTAFRLRTVIGDGWMRAISRIGSQLTQAAPAVEEQAPSMSPAIRVEPRDEPGISPERI
jgi:hypothetical protein